mmetsp:Transcript_6823/g.14162  ORF Transcript_6823/g.14162 Transcript_6823/m.14162 type:complete len:292 (+) Transcript_6823:782-1657(+)
MLRSKLLRLLGLGVLELLSLFRILHPPARPQLAILLLVLFLGALLLDFDGLAPHAGLRLDLGLFLALFTFGLLLCLVAVEALLLDLRLYIFILLNEILLKLEDVLEEALLGGPAPLRNVFGAFDVEHVHLLAQALPLLEVHAARGDLPRGLVDGQLRHLLGGLRLQLQFPIRAHCDYSETLDGPVETALFPIRVHELRIEAEEPVIGLVIIAQGQHLLCVEAIDLEGDVAPRGVIIDVAEVDLLVEDLALLVSQRPCILIFEGIIVHHGSHATSRARGEFPSPLPSRPQSP